MRRTVLTVYTLNVLYIMYSKAHIIDAAKIIIDSVYYIICKKWVFKP